jgi:acetyltransferase-like isoleucine patch superfamily enzyme
MMDIAELTGSWDYKALPPNFVLGKDCFLERRASFERFQSVRQPGLVLGNRVRVHTWTAFSVEPSGKIIVGDDTTLVGAIFMCAGDITIGSRVIVSYQVTIADCDFHPRDPELRRQDAIANAPGGDRSRRPPLVAKSVVIEDDVWIGIGAMVLKGVRIGRGARIGPGCIVTADVPPGSWVEGNPARPTKEQRWVDG